VNGSVLVTLGVSVGVGVFVIVAVRDGVKVAVCGWKGVFVMVGEDDAVGVDDAVNVGVTVPVMTVSRPSLDRLLLQIKPAPKAGRVMLMRLPA